MGLSICQQFVRLLGGEITVSSKLGKGSLFKFQIPIAVVEHQDDFDIKQPVKNFNFSPTREPNFSASNLTSLPPEWIEDLYQGAIAIDSDLILQAIEQISIKETSLAQKLTKMLKNFEYDELVELTERELKRRSCSQNFPFLILSKNINESRIS